MPSTSLHLAPFGPFLALRYGATILATGERSELVEAMRALRAPRPSNIVRLVPRAKLAISRAPSTRKVL